MAKAINRVKREKGDSFTPIVYICAPFSGDMEFNIHRAIRIGKIAYEKGKMPIIPHVQYPFMNDNYKKHRKDALRFDLILLSKCQEVWVLGDKVTAGMEKELSVAEKQHKTIRWFKEEEL